MREWYNILTWICYGSVIGIMLFADLNLWLKVATIVILGFFLVVKED